MGFLSQTTIQELQQILSEEYGKNLDMKEATEIAYSIIGYFELLTIINNRENERDSKKTY